MTYLSELARKEKARKLKMLATVLAAMVGIAIGGVIFGVLVELLYRAICINRGFLP